MKKTSILISGLLLATGLSFSQTLSPRVIASAGETFNSSTISLSWTVGELAVTTLSSAGNILTQGFHQPENGIAIGIASQDKLFSIHAFPNPIFENFTLEINTDQPEDFVVEITDILGKLVKSTGIYVGDGQARHTISMASNAAGAYLVKVTSKNGKFTKAIKLTKI